LSEVSPSLAPSMDIQVASNFERLLYFMVNKDSVKVREIMDTFRQHGRYCFEDFTAGGFSSCRATDAEIPELIKKLWEQHNYLVDPHTACAFKDLDPTKDSVILATAHPAKFPSVYEKAQMEIPKSPILESLLSIEPNKYEVGVETDAVRSFILEKLAR